MNSARLLLLLVGSAFLWFILKQVFGNWLSRSDRRRQYREIDAEERAIEREAGDSKPVCPLCGGPTKLHSYPHIKVWRCENYPDCRGFAPAKKPRRASFAADWERKRRRDRG